MATGLVLLAPGFEEIETATIVDVLRRGEVEVVLAGLHTDGPVEGSRGMQFVPDAAYDDASTDVDLLVLPGGAGGAEALADDPRVRSLIRERVQADRLVAAICAAPFALDEAGVLEPNGFTCYPGWEARLQTTGRRHEAVVEAGPIVTSQGPGTAMDFALRLVARLRGGAVAGEVARGLLARPSES